MTAYVIAIREKTHDAEALAAYSAAAALARREDMEVLAAYGACEALEGAPAEGVVLARFPDMEAGRAWFNSPEYQAARQHRLKGADYRFLLIQGR